VTARVDADSDEFLLHPNLLAAILELHERAGILSLVAHVTESKTLETRAGKTQISIESGEPARAIAAAHQLLRDAGILISAERANL
jgi:hypothetical protein